MDNLIRDVDEAINTGKFTHESLNWLRLFRRSAQKTKEVFDIYEAALKTIAGLGGPLTGEDATCFRTWAEEAIEAYNQEMQPTNKCTHPKGYIKSVRICGLCGEQLSG